MRFEERNNWAVVNAMSFCNKISEAAQEENTLGLLFTLEMVNMNSKERRNYDSCIWTVLLKLVIDRTRPIDLEKTYFITHVKCSTKRGRRLTVPQSFPSMWTVWDFCQWSPLKNGHGPLKLEKHWSSTESGVFLKIPTTVQSFGYDYLSR